jgi:hypothetical protein
MEDAMPDGIPPQPTDLFTRTVAPVLDKTRAIVQDLGLRPYRVFLIEDRWSGSRKGDGTYYRAILFEITPSPQVVVYSAARIAASGGALQAGTIALRGISRTYTKEQLEGQSIYGDDPPKNRDFFYALQPLGQIHADFYQPSSTPRLLPTEWKISLRPTSRYEPLVIEPDP